MGIEQTIDYESFPKQGDHLGRRVLVIFKYDRSHEFFGTVIRDDLEAPWRTIIQLDNGPTILGTECQYSLLDS